MYTSISMASLAAEQTDVTIHTSFSFSPETSTLTTFLVGRIPEMFHIVVDEESIEPELVSVSRESFGKFVITIRYQAPLKKVAPLLPLDPSEKVTEAVTARIKP